MKSVRIDGLTEALPGLIGIFADFFGIAIIAPILPEWVAARNHSPQWVGTILTGQYSAVVVGSLLFGVVADRFGAACALGTCMLIDTVAFAASAFAPTVEALLVMRIVAGLAAPQGLSIAWIASVSTPDQLKKRMGLVAAYIQLGILCGTIAAGFVSWPVACLGSAVPPAIVVLLTTQVRLPKKASSRRTSSLADGLYTFEFGSVASVMFANGSSIAVHFALFVVVLTTDYGLTRTQYALSLMPAAGLQVLNHAFVLPRLLGLAPPFALLTALATTLTGLYVVVIAISLAVPFSPWPFLVAQCLFFWAASFSQGVANFASATHARAAAPDAEAALIGSGRSAFNAGLAVGPSTLIAMYLGVNVQAALALIAGLYSAAAVVSFAAKSKRQLRSQDGATDDEEKCGVAVRELPSSLHEEQQDNFEINKEETATSSDDNKEAN